ncbi:hypothetical protein MW290_05115 [Aquincola tertiaricarbonis]|uniref:Uncharacterized protein n=1 Tax=Aquincola tertiaricarbonis TaxID=391953 RepID=A0ABY4S3E5_AQUTE|nr:hypothetical protein [Aquincola tertiaricarbonis]URI07966.1 hypothetical protein MW290_05115 [Aquincola tertiaricarbonis]
MDLVPLLERSDALHAALAQAVGVLNDILRAERATVTMDALLLSSQHAAALRLTLAAGLGASAIGLLRMQYEAVLRAVWALFAADASDVAALAAPLTTGTLKAAKSLGLAAELLTAIEKSQAPEDLKRSLREFRASSWDVLNSYIHAGIHPLRRADGNAVHELVVALKMSNGLAAITSALMVIVGQRPKRQVDINVVSTNSTDCLPQRHFGT